MAIALAIVLMFFMGMKIATVFLGKFPVVQANKLATGTDTIYAAPENINFIIRLEEPSKANLLSAGFVIWSGSYRPEEACFAFVTLDVWGYFKNLATASDKLAALQGEDFNLFCFNFHKDLAAENPVVVDGETSVNIKKEYNPTSRKNTVSGS